MADDNRKKRAELPTVPRMKAPKQAADPAQAPAARSGSRAKKTAKRQLVEELGDGARRDPRRESE